MKFSSLLKIGLIVVIFPLLAFSFSLHQVNELNASLKFEMFQYESMKSLGELKKAVNADEFICRRINDLFKKSISPSVLKNEIEKFSAIYALDLQIIIWKKNGDLFSSNLHKKINCDWKDAYLTLKKPFRSEFDLSADVHEENLQKIFGPLFYSRFSGQCFLTSDPTLIKCDSRNGSPLVWVRADSRFGLAVFVDHERLKDQSILRKEAELIKPPINCTMGVLAQGNIVSGSQSFINSGVDFKKQLSESLEKIKRFNGLLLFQSILDDDVIGFVVTHEKAIESEELPEWFVGLSLLTMLIVCSIAGMALKGIWNGAGNFISLRKQLLFLFLLANFVPIIFLGGISSNYLRQYEAFLKIKVASESMVYLQQIDESFSSEYTFQLKKMNEAVNLLHKELANAPVSISLIEEIVDKQSPAPYRLAIIGTHTSKIGSEIGVFNNRALNPIRHKTHSHVKAVESILEAIDKIGKYYLSLVNNENIPAKTLLKVELIAESITQIKPIDIFKGFWAAENSFWEWGMGKNSFPVYVKSIKLPKKKINDYLFLYFYMNKDLQKNFVRREFLNFNRNDLGLKIVLINDSLNYSLPEDALRDSSLKKITHHLIDFGSIDLDTCNFGGEEYLVTGLECSALNLYNLIGLYPVNELARKKWEKFQLLAASVLFSLFASLALGLFVSGLYLFPIEELQKGVIAFQRREFKFRLGDLGNDEFGELGHLFNETLEDFEELQVAEIVQKRLLPNDKNEGQVGCLSFCKFSFSSSQLGGDYFDSFAADGKEFFFLGDVAGNGVAASLVMAFVKSCILQLSELYESPASLLKKINSAICDSNTRKNRKAISMQYLVLNGNNAEVKIGNAGHCFPLLITGAGDLETINLPSYPLGSTPKGLVSETCLLLKPNERLILYSDGFYRSPGLSYDSFMNFIKRCSAMETNDLVAEMQPYLEMRNAESGSVDDATMIIIQRDVKNKTGKNVVEI